jgi:alanine transaminase
LEGVSCNQAQGAMYLFPKISLSEKAIQVAKSQKMEPDEYYCMEMLNHTGVCVVPGSGFRQEERTWHYRCTFLPKEELVDEFTNSILKFHEKFMKEHR